MMIPITVNEPMSRCSKCKEQQQSLVQQSYCINCTREHGRITARSSFLNDDNDEASSDFSLPNLPTNIVTLRMRPRSFESPEIQAAAILSSFRGEGDEITEKLFDVSTPKMVNTPPTGATYAFMTPFPQHSQASSPPPIKRENRNTIISLGFSSPSSPSLMSSSSSTISISSPIPPRLLLPEL